MKETVKSNIKRLKAVAILFFFFFFAQEQYLTYWLRPFIWARLASTLLQYFYFTEITHLIRSKRTVVLCFSHEDGIFKCKAGATRLAMCKVAGATCPGASPGGQHWSLCHQEPPSQPALADTEACPGCFTQLSRSFSSCDRFCGIWRHLHSEKRQDRKDFPRKLVGL